MALTMTTRVDFPTSEDFPGLSGKQTPLNLREAPGDHSHGEKNITLARRCGVVPMPWQCAEINAINAVDESGSWVHSDSVLIAARQNGKSLIVALIVIYRIFVLKQNVLFTAQRWETAKELWEHTWNIVRSRKFLMKLVESRTCSQGRGTIFLSNGGRVVFTTRSADAGRGLTKVDLLIFDESYNLTDAEIAALAFLSQAAPDPQVFYMSSAVHREFPQHQNGQVLSAMRAQALDEWDEADPIYLSEYAAPQDLDPTSEETWRIANPSYGVISNEKKMRKIMRRMNTEDGRTNFGVEALGWGLWFDSNEVDGEALPAVSQEQLDAVMTSERLVLRKSILALDASPDRASCSISVAGVDGSRVAGGLLWHGPLRLDEVVRAVEELCARVDPVELVVDPKSPAEVVIQPLIDRGFDPESIHRMSWPDVKSSTAAFLAGIDANGLRIGESVILREGFESATLREDRDGGVAWDRQSGVICQVVSLSHAMWAVSRFEEVKVDHRRPAQVRTVRRQVKQKQF